LGLLYYWAYQCFWCSPRFGIKERSGPKSDPWRCLEYSGTADSVQVAVAKSGPAILSRLKEQQSEKGFLLIYRPLLKQFDRFAGVGDCRFCFIRSELTQGIIIREITQLIKVGSNPGKISDS